jgi:uncharacterized membrane protein
MQFWVETATSQGGSMPRIVVVTLIIIIFGVAMFFLRRYMER